MHKATYHAGSNIAFIKYWGVADTTINLPMNNSISMTLDAAYTTTTVGWDVTNRLSEDEFTIDNARLPRNSSHVTSISYTRWPVWIIDPGCQPEQFSNGVGHCQFSQRVLPR